MAWLTVALLAGCAGLPRGQDPQDVAAGIAAAGGLVAVRERAGDFHLLTYRRGLEVADAPLTVYVEGDGRRWRGRRPPRDPTPYDPVGLRLAARDPGPAVLWIARPCMYLEAPRRAGCERRWWTSHRHASEVVTALDALITRVAGPGRPLVLVGHSGGGVLATLLAARREDVRGLITVGSPLDLGGWVRHHAITPLYGSLDPTAVAHALGALPQRHLAGAADEVVPPAVVGGFLRALPQPNRARLEIHPGQDHVCCWVERWPELRRTAW